MAGDRGVANAFGLRLTLGRRGFALGTQTLIVWGSEDAFQPLSYGARLADAMPNAQFEVIEQAGRFLPEDAPEALTQLMVNFMKRSHREAI